MKATTKEFLHDIFTIPNVLTLGRLALSPLVAREVYKDPGNGWKLAALFAFSDNIDGMLARLGDKHPELAKLGLRKSEFGRKADPFVDKIFTAEMLVAGMANGTVPKWLGALSLTQKGAVSVMTLVNERQGTELAVTKLGKYTEFTTNAGIGMLFIAEGIEDEQRRHEVRTAGLAIAAGGIIGASAASYGYYQKAKAIREFTPILMDEASSADTGLV